jgi:hypothetical protein
VNGTTNVSNLNSSGNTSLNGNTTLGNISGNGSTTLPINANVTGNISSPNVSYGVTSSTTISVFTLAQIAAIPVGQIAILTTTQLLSLSQAQLGALTAAQVAALTTSQILALIRSGALTVGMTQLLTGSLSDSALSGLPDSVVAPVTVETSGMVPRSLNLTALFQQVDVEMGEWLLSDEDADAGSIWQTFKQESLFDDDEAQTEEAQTDEQ